MSTAAATKPLLYHLPLGLTTYSRASLIQESLVSLHLAQKTHLLKQRHPPTSTITAATTTFPPLLPLPPPTIITSEFSPPVYTSGLRQQHKIPHSQKEYLTNTPHPVTGEYAEFIEARRGGQITWHGKGQCTIYPVVDLRALRLPPKGEEKEEGKEGRRVGVRNWVDLLESITIDVLHSYGVVAAGRDSVHPGVWVGENKITAVGVRVRRFVANHGVGVNVDTDAWWWGRVVACGIVGRGVTDLKREMGGRGVLPRVEQVGSRWVGEMARRLDRRVKVIMVEDVLGVGWEERFAARGEGEGREEG
ncbi:hypothetical protein BGX38DRAFT_1171459 [Terfezia claveryi]|nr:hypothetical protein BGX38DRAFT_1171459 [Terfezia claveryi]